MQFESKTFRGQGFQPCLVIACDEEEWAFGGKTGKIIRVAAGVQPLFKREPLPTNKLPSSIRAYGGNANTIQTLYSDEKMVTAAQERVARRGPDAAVSTPVRETGYSEESQAPAPKMVVLGRR